MSPRRLAPALPSVLPCAVGVAAPASQTPAKYEQRAVGLRRRRAACAGDVPGEGHPGRSWRALLRSSAKAAVLWKQERRSHVFEHRRR